MRKTALNAADFGNPLKMTQLNDMQARGRAGEQAPRPVRGSNAGPSAPVPAPEHRDGNSGKDVYSFPIRPGLTRPRNFTYGDYSMVSPYLYSYARPGGKAAWIDTSRTPISRNLIRNPIGETTNFMDDLSKATGDPEFPDRYRRYLKGVPTADVRKFVPNWNSRDAKGEDARTADEFTGVKIDGRNVATMRSPALENYSYSPYLRAFGLPDMLTYGVPRNSTYMPADPKAALWWALNQRSAGQFGLRSRVGQWDHTYGLIPGDPADHMMSMLHEKRHLNQLNASGFPGAPKAWNPEAYSHIADRDDYARNPDEQMQAAGSLNTAYQAALNDMASNPGKWPADWVRQMQAYPAYGTREQFKARNRMLMANPAMAQQLIGPEALRGLVGYSDLLNRLPKERSADLIGFNERFKALRNEYRKRDPENWINSLFDENPGLLKQLIDNQSSMDLLKHMDRFDDMYWMTRNGQGQGNYKHASLGAARLLAGALGRL